MKTHSKDKGGIFVKASCTAVAWTELDESLCYFLSKKHLLLFENIYGVQQGKLFVTEFGSCRQVLQHCFHKVWA